MKLLAQAKLVTSPVQASSFRTTLTAINTAANDVSQVVWDKRSSEHVVDAVAAIIHFAYFTTLNGSVRGQTAGKMALRISVRDADSAGPIGMGGALVQVLLSYLAALIFFIPWLVDVLRPLWGPRHQALHDETVRRVVVMTPPLSAQPS